MFNNIVHKEKNLTTNLNKTQKKSVKTIKTMLQPSKQQVLRLYKHLIRYGHQLQLTDKSYFLGTVRREFRENISETDKDKINFYFKRGETLLRKGRIL